LVEGIFRRVFIKAYSAHKFTLFSIFTGREVVCKDFEVVRCFYVIFEVIESVGVFVKQSFIVSGTLHDGHQLFVQHICMQIILLVVVLVSLCKLVVYITTFADFFKSTTRM
jgi:hypothetical protein